MRRCSPRCLTSITEEKQESLIKIPRNQIDAQWEQIFLIRSVVRLSFFNTPLVTRKSIGKINSFESRAEIIIDFRRVQSIADNWRLIPILRIGRPDNNGSNERTQRMTCTADHKCTRIIPLRVIIAGSFLQIARSSSRYSAHPDGGIPTPRVCVRVGLTHTRYPPVPGSHVRSHVHGGTPATTTTRGNSVPAHPWLSGKTLRPRRRPSSSSFSGPADPPSRSVSGNTLSSAPRPSNRISKSRRSFEEEASESRFPTIEDRGSIA